MIVFSTRSQDVIQGLGNSSEISQVYLRNLAGGVNGSTILVSQGVSLNPQDPPGTPVVGNASSDFPKISDDGTTICWSSGATNLPPNDPNGPLQFPDVFLYDVPTGNMTRIESPTGDAGNGRSVEPFLSGSGRYVSFTSRASNLAFGIGPFPFPQGGCPPAVQDPTQDTILLYDRGDPNGFPMVPPSLTWASIGTKASGCPEAPDEPCIKSSVSATGCFVAFLSKATNLTPEGSGGMQQVFMRNMLTGVTKLVSHDGNGDPSQGSVRTAEISRDGNWVVFESGASDLVVGDTNGLNDTFAWNRISGTITRVSIDSFGDQISGMFTRGQIMNPHISGSGRFVFWTSWVPEFNQSGNDFEIYVHDRDYDSDGFFDAEANGIYEIDEVRTIRMSDRPSSTGPDDTSNRGFGGNCWASSDGKYFVFMGFGSDMVDASDIGGLDTNGDDEPNDLSCCPGGPMDPNCDNPGDTGRDVFRRIVWGQ